MSQETPKQNAYNRILSGYAWHNGTIKPVDDTKVDVLSHGIHYGSGFFEGIRTYNGKAFKLREHMERFMRSAEILSMKLNYSLDQLIEGVEKIVEIQSKALGTKDLYIRPLAIMGSERASGPVVDPVSGLVMAPPGMGVAPAADLQADVSITVWRWGKYFSDQAFEKGVSLSLTNWKRPDYGTSLPAAKATALYPVATGSKIEATGRGFDDALLPTYRGDVAEASAANFFMVKDGVLHTPVPDCFLNGITRQTIIEMAKAKNIPVKEQPIQFADLRHAEEIFIVGTAVEVMPVGLICFDKTLTKAQAEQETNPDKVLKLPVGALTKEFMADYDTLKYADDYQAALAGLKKKPDVINAVIVQKAGERYN